jgi:predicted Fe-Mo cluster-binding NifX family protein
MTLIALTCQNRREITEHAGQCRNFLIYEAEDGRIGEPRLLELPRGESLHDTAGHQAHALDGVDWLISASMGDGLRHKLAARGVHTLLTTERNPLLAVQRFVAGQLPDEAVPHQHGEGHGQPPHEHAHEHRPAHGQGGGCGGGGCACQHAAAAEASETRHRPSATPAMPAGSPAPKSEGT